MPSTTYTDSTFSVAAIGARTDNAGGAVSDYTAEEARFVLQILTQGVLTPAGAFTVAEQDTPDMTVKVGSGTAKADYFVLEGQTTGQGNYVVRLDVTDVDVTIDAADAAQDRTDEIYLVVRDNAYDASSRALPQIGYRKGDLGGAVPGADAGWEAYALLATVSVPANETAIETANITDERETAALISGLATADAVTESLLDAKGDLIVASAADTAARLAVGTNGYVLTADSGEATGVKWDVGGFTDIDVQVFTSSGTWTKPAGAVLVWAQVTGGGGGGSYNGYSGGGGGGAGGYTAKMFAAGDLASTEAVTVGAGGAGGAEPTGGEDGEDGGDSVFDALTGEGGTGGIGHLGVFGGDGIGGDINATGGQGGDRQLEDGSNGGLGGGSFWGGSSNQILGGPPGAGGFGADEADVIDAGDGQDGIVVITTYIS